MAICVHCTTLVPSLWTVYSSATNVRLCPCPACHQFADPYVEQPLLVIALDLVLMNAKVYRHLLFNRGTLPMKVRQSGFSEPSNRTSKKEGSKEIISGGRKESIDQMLIFLTIVTILAESYLRWTSIRPQNGIDRSTRHIEVFAKCFFESFMDSLAFQGSITLVIVLILAFWRTFVRNPNTQQGSRLGSIYMLTKLVPLSIQLSSCPKLVLLLLVSIWRPSVTTPKTSTTLLSPSPPLCVHHLGQLFDSYTSSSFSSFIYQTIHSFPILSARLAESLTEMFEMTDREQVIRTVLGGLGAGFGLSVLLKPIHIGSPRGSSVDFNDGSAARVTTRPSDEKMDNGEKGSRSDPKKGLTTAVRAWLDSTLIIFLVLWGYVSREYASTFMID